MKKTILALLLGSVHAAPKIDPNNALAVVAKALGISVEDVVHQTEAKNLLRSVVEEVATNMLDVLENTAEKEACRILFFDQCLEAQDQKEWTQALKASEELAKKAAPQEEEDRDLALALKASEELAKQAAPKKKQPSMQRIFAAAKIEVPVPSKEKSEDKAIDIAIAKALEMPFGRFQEMRRGIAQEVYQDIDMARLEREGVDYFNQHCQKKGASKKPAQPEQSKPKPPVKKQAEVVHPKTVEYFLATSFAMTEKALQALFMQREIPAGIYTEAYNTRDVSFYETLSPQHRQDHFLTDCFFLIEKDRAQREALKNMPLHPDEQRLADFLGLTEQAFNALGTRVLLEETQQPEIHNADFFMEKYFDAKEHKKNTQKPKDI